MLPDARTRFRRAARAVKGALGRFLDRIVIAGPAAYDIPPEDWPRFPPY